MAIKNLTYRDLMIVMNKIKAKGYTEQEALPIARNLFREFNPHGLSIEAMIKRVLSKEEWEKENEQC